MKIFNKFFLIKLVSINIDCSPLLLWRYHVSHFSLVINIIFNWNFLLIINFKTIKYAINLATLRCMISPFMKLLYIVVYVIMVLDELCDCFCFLHHVKVPNVLYHWADTIHYVWGLEQVRFFSLNFNELKNTLKVGIIICHDLYNEGAISYTTFLWDDICITSL